MLDSLDKNMNGKSYRIYAFVLDNESFEILSKLDKPNVILINPDDFEDSTLRRLRVERSIAEYCWTCTSHSIYFLFKKLNLSMCTYIDADLYFYSDPTALIDELGKDSVLITLHRFSWVYKWLYSRLAGKYCVQFMTFRNNKDGLEALTWWKDKCVNWCFARYEDGKFGDQLYLNDWCHRFNGIHVLKNEGALGPWSIVLNYKVSQNQKHIYVKNYFSKRNYNLVFYHFSYLKFYYDRRKVKFLDLGSFFFKKTFIKMLYAPYVFELLSVSEKLEIDYKTFFLNYSDLSRADLKTKLRGLFGISIYKLSFILNN